MTISPKRSSGLIITFYSYKGGVGRSMALANVAVLLARWGGKVLVVDWDLEAPGIERYFEEMAPGCHELIKDRRGIVDIADGLAKGIENDWEKCIFKIPVSGTDGHIDLLSAGRRDAGYVQRLQKLAWDALFTGHDFGHWLEAMRDSWRNIYDYILIDSRTGITDIGGICTIYLPDILVAMFTANHQSVEGVADVISRARRARSNLPVDRGALVCIPVPARDESRTEYRQSVDWRNIYHELFSEFYIDFLPRNVSAEEALDLLRIPNVPFWSFGERLPVLTESAADPSSITYFYIILARLIATDLSWQDATSSQPVSVSVTDMSSLQEPLRVFISHTDELRRYPLTRSFVTAAEQAIARAGNAALNMEYFSTRDDKPQEYVRGVVQHADVYVGIIGFRYGATVRDVPNESYTELEFDIATERGLPRLLFLLDEDAVLPLPQSSLSDPRYAEQQRAFRARLMDTGATILRVATPEEIEVLLFQAMTDPTLQMAARASSSESGMTAGIAVRLSPRPTFLAGREELLAQLRARLSVDLGAGPRVTALSGLGGVGKTSVAVEYAYRNLGQFGVVWQFAAEDPAALAAAFSELATQLGAREIADTGDPVAQVHAALARRQDWLLIFDNVLDPAAISNMLPPAGAGQVVITSQYAYWPAGWVLEVPVLGQAEASEFLLTRTGADSSATPAANELASELGGLPLALAQAAAYMTATGRNINEYLDLFRHRRADLLSRGEPAGYSKQVATTWQLAFAEIGESSPAAGLLRFVACCAPQEIPLDVLLRPRPEVQTEFSAEVAPLLVPLLEDPLVCGDAIAELRRYSLISAPRDGRVSVGRLVQAITLDQLPSDLTASWQHATAAVIEAALPNGPEDPATWPTFAELLPHAQAALTPASPGMSKIADYLGATGNYLAARALAESIFRVREEDFGPEHTETLAARSDLAYWTGVTGDAIAARDQYGALVPVFERILGAEHPRTLTVRSNLAYWTGEAGDPTAARDQLAALLPISERVLGADHPRALAARVNMAQWTGAAGDAASARDQYAVLLPMRERVLGADHPDTLAARASLAQWTGAAGDAASARDQYAALLPVFERIWGTEHPRTLTVRSNLAYWTGEAGDPTAARDQFAALLPISERILGPDHPDTEATRRILALWAP